MLAKIIPFPLETVINFTYISFKKITHYNSHYRKTLQSFQIQRVVCPNVPRLDSDHSCEEFRLCGTFLSR